MAEYYCILTNAGQAAVAAALEGGAPVAFAQFAVGDSNGTYVEPLATQTELANEIWRGDVNRVYVHPQNENWVVVEAMIPVEDGGFDIREAGLLTPGTPGTLLAVGKYPLTTKPAPGSGSEKELYVRMVLQVSNGGEVVQTIDPTLVLATEAYVDAYADAHAALTDPHSATWAATADRLVLRDSAGRAKVTVPAVSTDIALLGTVEAHSNLTGASTPHGATAAATAATVMKRDGNGRAQVAAPSADGDIVNLHTLNLHALVGGELTPHGATAAATQNTLMKRDSAGRAKVVAPTAESDIALKSTVTDHNNVFNAHGAYASVVANRLVLRDAAGRAQVAAPSAAADIARLDTVTAHSNLTSAHSATSAATPFRLVIRDANGRAKVATPAAADDMARLDTVTGARVAAGRFRFDTNWTLGNNAWTKLPLHMADFWEAAAFGFETQTIKVKVATHRYLSGAAQVHTGGTTGERRVQIVQEFAAGGSLIVAKQYLPSPGSAVNLAFGPVAVALNDRFRVEVYQNSGASVTVYAGADNSWLTLALLS